MSDRSERYRQRWLAAGGNIVQVRMSAAQLELLNRTRLPGESRSACVNRVIEDRRFQAELNRARR